MRKASHMKKCGLGSAMAVAIGLPTSAAAQTTEDKTEIKVEVNGRYDSNISRSSDLQASQRGLTRSDFRLSPALTLDLARNFGENSAYVRGSLGYDIHTRNSVLDRERLGLRAGGELAAGPCRVRPDVGFSRQQSDLADIVVIDGLVPDAVRNTETRLFYGAELACGGAIGVSPYASIRREQARNSNALRDLAEFNETSYSAGLEYRSPTVGTIRAFISRDDVDLIRQPLAGGTNGYKVTNYGASISREVGTRLKADASVTFSDLKSHDPRIAGFSGLNWDLGLTLLVNEQTQIQARYGRQLVNSLSSNSAYVVEQPFDFRLTYAVSERLRLEAGGQFSKRRFEFAGVPGADFIDRENRRVLDAGVRYQFSNRLALRVNGGHERRNANGSLFDYSSTFVGGGISLSI